MIRRLLLAFSAAALCAVLLVLLAARTFAQDTAGNIITAACADNGAVLKWLVAIFGTSTAASFLANFRNRLPAGLVSVIDVVGLNFIKAVEASAASAKKAAPALLACLLVAATLGACSTAQLQTAAADAQAACTVATATAASVQSQLKGGAQQTASNIAAYVAGGCPLVNGAITVAANVAADPNGTAWVNSLTTMLQSLAAPAPAPAPAAAPAAKS